MVVSLISIYQKYDSIKKLKVRVKNIKRSY